MVSSLSENVPHSEIRPYIFEILMFLVGVHAQVSAAAAPLLERTLNALVEDVAEEALRCFRQVKRFGMGGMLRVRRIPPRNRLFPAAATEARALLTRVTNITHRPRSRLSSYTKHSRVTSLPLLTRRCRICTRRSHRHMRADPETRICKPTSMG